jgi:hypothetical protein
MSDWGSFATTEARSSLPPGPTRSRPCTSSSASAVVTTSPPSATATPINTTLPCGVEARSCTKARPAESAAGGTTLPWPTRVVIDALSAVSWVEPALGRDDAGDSRTRMPATAAMTAPTPTSTMTAPR